MNTKPKKTNPDVCINCGTEGSLILDETEGQMVCMECGVTQNQVFSNNTGFEGNATNGGKVQRGGVIVGPHRNTRVLVKNFMSEIQPLSENNNWEKRGNHLAQTIEEFKTFKSQFVSKGTNRETTLRGLHLPTLIVCILYCDFIESQKTMPMSMMIYYMNNALSKTKEFKDATPVKFKEVTRYRTHKSIGLYKFLANNRCYTTVLKAGDFVRYPLNINNIQDKRIKTLAEQVANELQKEYPVTKAASNIGCGVVHFISNKVGRFDGAKYNLPKAELEGYGKAIKSSQNPKIIELLEVFK